MAGPWEKFSSPGPVGIEQSMPTQEAPQQAETGPWAKFQAPAAPQMPQQATLPGVNPDVPQPTDPAQDFVSKVWGGLEKQESARNGQASVSPKGAIGVAQVMPGTAPEAAALAGLPFNDALYRTDANYNRAFGQAYAKKQFQDFGDDRLALAAYNAGPTRVRDTIDKVGDPSKGEVTWKAFSAALPAETRDYVQKILPQDDGGLHVPDWLKETGRVLDTGVKQGLRSSGQALAGAYRGTEQVAREMYEKAGVPLDALNNIPFLPSKTPGQYLQQGVDYLTNPIERPQTEVGEHAADVLGAVTAGATLPIPGVSMAAGAVQGLGVGLGTEAAQAALGDNPLTNIAGGVLGGAVGGLAHTLTSAAGNTKLASQALKDVSPYELEAARNAMNQGKEQGINLTLGQALPTAGSAKAVEKALAATPEGSVISNQLRQQPQEIANAAQGLQKTLPGEVLPAAQVNNQAQQAATQSIQAAKDFRTAQVKPYFAASGMISPEHAKKILQQVKDAAADSPGTAKGELLSRLADKLTVSKVIYKAGQKVGTKQLPLLDIQKINGVLRSEQNAAKNVNVSSAAGDLEAVGMLNAVATGIRGQLGDVSPAFAKGNKEYADLTQNLVNPLRQGPVGEIAGTAGYNAAKAAPGKILSIFDKGTVVDPKTGVSAGSRILTTQAELAKGGTDGAKAFLDAGTTWIANGFDKALKNVEGGVAPDAAKRIEAQFFGTQAKTQGTKDVLAGMARSAGVPEKTLVDGMQNFAKTVQRAASSLPKEGSGAGTAVNEALETPAGLIGKWSVIQPFRQPALALQNLTSGQSKAYISKLMTTPEGIATLQQLAKVQPGSSKSYKLLYTINALMSSETKGE